MKNTNRKKTQKIRKNTQKTLIESSVTQNVLVHLLACHIGY